MKDDSRNHNVCEVLRKTEHHVSGRVPRHQIELGRRSSFTCTSRLQRLNAGRKHFRADRRVMGTAQHRPVRCVSKCSVTPFCQSVPRPCGNDGGLPGSASGLGEMGKPTRESSVLNDNASPRKTTTSQNSAGHHDAYSAVLAVEALVAGATSAFERYTKTSPSVPGTLHDLLHRATKKNCPELESSRSALIEQSLESVGISPDAIKLLLKGIATATRDEYDRHFDKWRAHCRDEKHCICDFSDVNITNCLTKLFTTTQSKATFDHTRSALSSVTELFHRHSSGLQLNRRHIQAQILKAMSKRCPDVVRHLSQCDITTVFKYILSGPPWDEMTEEQVRQALAVCLILDACGRPVDMYNCFRERVIESKCNDRHVVIINFKDPKEGSRSRKNVLWSTTVAIEHVDRDKRVCTPCLINRYTTLAPVDFPDVEVKETAQGNTRVLSYTQMFRYLPSKRGKKPLSQKRILKFI